MVPIQRRHIIPMYSTMSVENLFEAEAVYKIDLMKTLIQYSETPDVFVIENDKEKAIKNEVVIDVIVCLLNFMFFILLYIQK